MKGYFLAEAVASMDCWPRPAPDVPVNRDGSLGWLCVRLFRRAVPLPDVPGLPRHSDEQRCDAHPLSLYCSALVPSAVANPLVVGG